MSKSYRNRERMWANGAQPKACRACGKKGHMSAACMVPKDKLYCKYCDKKSSHKMSPERRQRDLSKSFKTGHGQSPINHHNSCVQLQLKEDNGNYLSWNNDNSDDNSY